jgi:hypothetical protein
MCLCVVVSYWCTMFVELADILGIAMHAYALGGGSVQEKALHCTCNAHTLLTPSRYVCCVLHAGMGAGACRMLVS